MASSNPLDNPMLLFGDIRPDVIELSKVYDPDNDVYVRSTDDHVVSGTQYYRRNAVAVSSSTVPVPVFSFTKVDPTESGYADANPYEENWYVFNEYGRDQTGCYIPADHSLVVVDQGTDFYKERTVLIVESVDRDTGTDANPRVPTYKAKLVPINLGTGEEVTARAIDYGNQSMYLYYEDVLDPNDSSNTFRKVTPDRKLMLFGQRYYTYRIIKENTPIVGPTPGVHEMGSAAVSFICAGASKVTLTAENIVELVGKQFDIVGLDRVYKFKIPAAGSLMSTLDLYFSGTKTYKTWNQYTRSGDHYLPGEYAPMIKKDGYLYFQTTDHKVRSGKTYYYNTSNTVTNGVPNYTFAALTNPKVNYVLYGSTGARPYDRSTTATPNYIYTLYERVQIGSAIDRTSDDPSENIDVVETIDDPMTCSLIGLTGYVHNDERVGVENIFYPGSGFVGENFTLTDGELVTMEVYELGNEEYDRCVTPRTSPLYPTAVATTVGSTSVRMVMNVTLTVRAGTAWNAGEGSTKQIVGFDIVKTYPDWNNPSIDNALSVDPNDPNVWYLLPTDTKADLPNKAELIFDDNTRKIVPIDGKACHMYGLERLANNPLEVATINARPLTLGMEYPLLFKYFPQQQLGKDWEGVTVKRSKSFVCCRKKVRCVNAAADQIRKISIVPIWDDRNDRYRFRFLVYDVNMESPSFLTLASDSAETQTNPSIGLTCAYQTGNTEYTIDPEQAAAQFNIVYHANISYMAAIANYKTTLYTQGIAFCLQDWTDTSAGVEKWRLGDNMNSWDLQTLGYGKHVSPMFLRPYITYDQTDQTFQIGPIFTDADTFVDQFYTKAYESSSSADIILQPTHFRIRTVDTNSLAYKYTDTTTGETTTDIPISEFKSKFKLESGNAVEVIGGAYPGRNDSLAPVMGIVVVEFVNVGKVNGVNVARALYGVPVEVRDAAW